MVSNTTINKNNHLLNLRRHLISLNLSPHKQTKSSYLQGWSLRLSRNCQYKKTRQWCRQWPSMVTRRHSLKEVLLHHLHYRASRPLIWSKEMPLLTKILSRHSLDYFFQPKTQLVLSITLHSNNRSYKSRSKWRNFKSNWWESLVLIP